MENTAAVTAILESFDGSFVPSEMARIARALREAGLSVGEIASVMYSKSNGLGLGEEELVWALHKGLGLSAEKTAVVMCELLENDSEMHKYVALALLHGFDFGERKVARVLASKDGPAWPAEDIFVGLCANNCSYSDIADALHRGVGMPINEVARLMYYDSVYGVDEYEVAQSLYNRYVLKLSAERVARVLYAGDGLNLLPETVARVLTSEDGLYLDDYATARILRRLGLSIKNVVRVLDQGLDLEKHWVAKVLTRPEGLGMSEDEAASALEAGLGLSAEEAAEVLDAI